MTEPPIRIDRGELFDPAVDKALARERAGRERVVADAPPVSALRRLLLNSMFYLPLAAMLGAFITWALIDPQISDQSVVGGEIVLVNAEPFDLPRGILALTVGSHEVLIDPQRLRFERGVHGEAPLASADDLKVGARIEAVGLPEGHRLIAAAIRPTDNPASHGEVERPQWPLFLLFPLTAALIACGLLLSEGITTRNWIRMIERTLLGSFLATLFTVLAFIPAGLVLQVSNAVMASEVHKHPGLIVVTIKEVGPAAFLLFTACRSAAWACIGAAAGFGMNLVRSTRTQLRNSVIGGALGGALGGMFFDPIDRLFGSSLFVGSSTSRFVGQLAVGLSIGIFVALVERLGRDAWLRVRTGPLAGKSFILYKTPSILGSSPQSDVYLYKDADIDPSHVAVHRVGTIYEIEDLGTRMGTSVGGNRIRRRRLVSGDQIIIGSTILDFEERQKRTPAA
jgi:FHA domain-containing protein